MLIVAPIFLFFFKKEKNLFVSSCNQLLHDVCIFKDLAYQGGP